MEKFEQLQKEYKNNIEELINFWRTKGNEEKNNGNEFEYTKAIIRLNIIEIYMKMFNVAKKKSQNESSFHQTYLDLLNNIYSPWEERLVKDKQFGMEEEYLIGEIKIAISEEIFKIFKECYKNIYEV